MEYDGAGTLQKEDTIMRFASQGSVTVDPMTPRDLDLAIEWAAREGWNPGLDDAACFYPADPEGFLIAYSGKTPVGTISAVRYGEDFGFIGLYLVTPDRRGRQIGLVLADKALRHLAGRCIGLDGVEQKVRNYAAQGFRLAWRNVRYKGTAAPQDARDAHVVSVTPELLPEIEAYDRLCFPAPRSDFLAAWTSAPHATTLAWRDDAIRGYGTIRQCREGYKVGPLFADTPDVAWELFNALGASVPAGEAVFLDVPEPHAVATALAKEHAMTPVFATARMYNQDPPTIDLNRVFGVTTFELG